MYSPICLRDTKRVCARAGKSVLSCMRERKREGRGEEDAQNECTVLLELTRSPLSLFLSLPVSLTHAQSFEILSILLSVPIAQLAKACQSIVFSKVHEFKSQPCQITFEVNRFDWGKIIATSWRDFHNYNLTT